jgi:subfamily B ATP-binding cassette protein MsbA
VIQFFEQSLGGVVVALLLLHRTTQSLFSIQGGWQGMMAFIGSVEMIQDDLRFATLHREQRGTQKLGSFERMVEFRNVSFAYNASDGDVLTNLVLTIPRNHTIALVGRSGAGKTTLADLVALLHRPRLGSIHIDGQDTQGMDPRTWRNRIGYVCQETVVFDDTVAANICLSESGYRDDSECRRRVHEAAERAFAVEFIESLPDGCETVVGDRGIRLSGGQRQRLLIARELYRQPELLILDEATSALDGASEQAIQQSISALRGQMTVVVIAHRLATIKNADYIYVLEKGQIIEQGPYEQLHSVVDSTFRRMVEVQSL